MANPRVRPHRSPNDHDGNIDHNAVGANLRVRPQRSHNDGSAGNGDAAGNGGDAAGRHTGLPLRIARTALRRVISAHNAECNVDAPGSTA
jgi:hypothetical protein